MTTMMFSFGAFDSGVFQGNLGSNSEFDIMFGEKGSKQSCYVGEEHCTDSTGAHTFSSDFGFCQDNSRQEDLVFQKNWKEYGLQYAIPADDLLEGSSFDINSPSLHMCLEEIANLRSEPTGIRDDEHRKEKQHAASLASLELLKSYGYGPKKLDGNKIVEPSSNTAINKLLERSLSTEEITRFAGLKFVQTASSAVSLLETFGHPYGLYFSGLSDQETDDVQLVELLLLSAEKVSNEQYDRASKLLNQCDYLSSDKGNPIQRLVFYFVQALREKIDRGTGRIGINTCRKRQELDPSAEVINLSRSRIACYQEIPFVQVTQFAGVQAIVENVADATKIHVIDLNIGSGVQWTILMQALASRYGCQIELLKITALGTCSKHLIDETGKRLVNFAQSMNLTFSFKLVMVQDVLHLKKDLFDLDSDEAVAIYSQYFLRTMIGHTDYLDSMMKVIRSINPHVMIVVEIEANHNSPNFVDRFTEALFYYAAYFDCLEASMSREDTNRMIMESVYLGEGLANILAAEGNERKVRHVKISVWRAFFARFGMKEVELSASSLYQANLLVKNFSYGMFCTLNTDGKSLLVGWKGTPMHSLSVLKFT